MMVMMMTKAVVVVAVALASLIAVEALSTPGSSSQSQVSTTSRRAEPSNKATQIMQGVGAVQVDLNRYNLNSLDDITQQWTANLKQKAGEKEVTVALGARNDKELFVDQVQALIPRRKGTGLGIELLELAGGREDGLGITIVSGLVEGGPADGLDIMPGDSISQITLVRRRRQQTDGKALSETGELIPVKTECLSYDATVQAILSLPAYDEKFEETFEIIVKRVRKKPKVSIRLQYPPSQKEKDATIELFAGENLRMGMLVRGVKLNDPLAKRFDTKNGGNCGAGGLCRTCAVSVIAGQDLLNPQRPAEKQMLADSPRWRLACKAIVGYGMKEGQMTIRVNPRQFV